MYLGATALTICVIISTAALRKYCFCRNCLYKNNTILVAGLTKLVKCSKPTLQNLWISKSWLYETSVIVHSTILNKTFFRWTSHEWRKILQRWRWRPLLSAATTAGPLALSPASLPVDNLKADEGNVLVAGLFCDTLSEFTL